MLVTIVSLFVALSIMVLVHEFGHLVAAKRAGIVVEEFGVGYPPRVLSVWRSRGVVVIGGRRITIPREVRWPQDLRAGSLVRYQTATDAKGRTVLAHVEAAQGGAEDGDPSARVEFLDLGTLYSFNAIPFGGFARMLGEEDPSHPGSFASKSKLTRVWVLVAGATMNLVAAVLFFALGQGLGAPVTAPPPNVVLEEVVPGSPAALAGLRAGDVLAKMDGVDIVDVEGLQSYVAGHVTTSILFTVLRDEQVMTAPVVPRAEPPAGEGPTGMVLRQRTIIQKHPWYQALWLGLRRTLSTVADIFTVPVRLIRGLIPAEVARPVGPVGIGRLMGDAVRYSLGSGWWFPVVELLGSLSVALAVTNLLPLPGLDGGRVLFVVVEGIRGRRVDPAREGLVHLIGLALLVALMLVVTWQDVVNPMARLDWSRLFQ